MGRGVQGTADAVVLPGTTEEVAAVMRWCYEHDVPLTARGGGTGLAGGAIPVEGGVVLGFERLNRVRQFDPLLWRMHVEAGVTTADVQRLARESGLRFPPDPGAAEISQIGGNIACNAGGPHAFKYGVTGHWVTGLEAVIPPGEIVHIGGPLRKDVAGYDLKSLLVGSEGTLGVVTAAWLRLIPAPELELPVIGLYRDAEAGISAIERVLGSGIVPAAVEYLDAVTLAYSGDAYPFGIPDGATFMVITEADGAASEARRVAAELQETLADDAVAVHAPDEPSEVAELWRWRGGVGFAILAQRGGAYSEDIAVPLDRLRDVERETLAIGERHGVPSLSFGHAGDGNIHSTFLFSAGDADEERARRRRVPRALRPRAATRRHGHRRARHRLAEARPARAPARRDRLRPALPDQAGLRPEGPAQPRQEALSVGEDRPDARRRQETDPNARHVTRILVP